MADMLDYLAWRGDIEFTQLPVNPVDALIFSTLSYINFQDIVPDNPHQSISLAEEINKRAEKIGKVQKVLLEVNVSGEESKFGISPENIMEFCEKIAEFKNIRVSGLMTVAPFTEDEKILRKVFSDLRKISLDISTKFYDTIYMEELSMGMTNDYEIAIEEGATMVRVGTGIFGNR